MVSLCGEALMTVDSMGYNESVGVGRDVYSVQKSNNGDVDWSKQEGIIEGGEERDKYIIWIYRRQTAVRQVSKSENIQLKDIYRLDRQFMGNIYVASNHFLSQY